MEEGLGAFNRASMLVAKPAPAPAAGGKPDGDSAAASPAPAPAVAGDTGTPQKPPIPAAAFDMPKPNLRGINKPKCIRCGNVARSRCPFQCCKACCYKDQNPCHIHGSHTCPRVEAAGCAAQCVRDNHEEMGRLYEAVAERKP